MSRERASYDMAVTEDRDWICHLCIEKDRNRDRLGRSLVMVMVTGGRIGVPRCPVIVPGREILSLVHLLSTSHHLPWPTMGDGLVRTFFRKKSWGSCFGGGERGRVFPVSLRLQEQADSARMDLIDLGHGLVQSLFKTYQQELEVSLAS